MPAQFGTLAGMKAVVGRLMAHALTPYCFVLDETHHVVMAGPSERADPFVRQRLLELASSYEKAERRPTRLAATPADLKLSGRGSQASER